MKTALLALDFINDIVHPDGKISHGASYLQEHHVLERANQVITYSTKKQFPIAFVKVGFSSNYIECPSHSPLFGKAKEFSALKLDSWGTEIHDSIKVSPDNFIIIKHRVSAFYATSLETFLRANDIKRLFIIGVSTDNAVNLTAREAHDRDYQVVIVADACGAVSTENHNTALKLLERIAQVITTHQLKEMI